MSGKPVLQVATKGKYLYHLFVQFVRSKRLIIRQLVIHTRERLFGLVATAGLAQAPVCQQQILHYYIH